MHKENKVKIIMTNHFITVTSPFVFEPFLFSLDSYGSTMHLNIYLHNFYTMLHPKLKCTLGSNLN